MRRVARDHGLDRLAHRAQVHRHVRRVGDQVAVGVEQRAGEVEPLLDVHRVGGVLQAQAHLLGDVHEEVVEDLEHHRVGRRCRCACAAARGCTRASTRSAARGELAPASRARPRWWRCCSAMIAGPSIAAPGAERLAHDRAPASRQRRRCTCARGSAGAGDARAALGAPRRLDRRSPRADRLHRDRLDHQRRGRASGRRSAAGRRPRSAARMLGDRCRAARRARCRCPA